MNASAALLPAPSTAPPPDAAGAVRPELAVRGVWRGTEIGRQATAVVPTGWAPLDRELPGGGWPTQSLTEVLAAQPAAVEWRLLAPALRQVAARGGQIVAVGPPHPPYLPGLRQEGLDERCFVWIDARTPAERLWTAEQLLKANACGAVVAWLPQARPEQVRRLQVCAQSCEGLAFLCRPAAARHESSAAPLRVQADPGPDWELRLHILKRRGPLQDEPLVLPSMPGGLAALITPRLRHPSRLLTREDPADAVGGTVIALRTRRNAAVQ
ncbi:RecA/RadA recombinase [Castellaniella defragrans 65Phen]|uniref:RecA/RadA recombinase n=3 Tax=Castellaniella defragrans TaxID=75697 RepID=W8X0P0_CASD6|nr:translesion DNA synthesis-associated protein ImuA [Castellaniella defragrans]MBB6083326.1 protein ImuA [Castellaniella defragrans]CDM25474.1 RecA/RadA recombinase [Castellaniella defragrans 65Phen]